MIVCSTTGMAHLKENMLFSSHCVLTCLLMQTQGDPPGYIQVPLRHQHKHFKVEIEWSVNYPVHTQDCVILIFLETRLGNICVHFRCLFPKSTKLTSNCCVFLLT